MLAAADGLSLDSTQGTMNGMDDCTSIRYELGVYLLGAIAPADRARVVRHLASCERCRDEVAGMAALPALLRRLPYETAAHLGADSAAPVSPDLPSAIPGSLAGRIAGRRRTRRWLTATTVAALSAAAGKGNDVDASGGVWHQAAISGRVTPSPAGTANGYGY
jgi:anti-sigma factor RsiW